LAFSGDQFWEISKRLTFQHTLSGCLSFSFGPEFEEDPFGLRLGETPRPIAENAGLGDNTFWIEAKVSISHYLLLAFATISMHTYRGSYRRSPG
jgi:hypothetical protein